MPSHRPRSGSTKSTKVMEHSVLSGLRVTAYSGGVERSGYVYGMDDYHWLLVEPDSLSTLLVHKSEAVVRIEAVPTYEDEVNHDEMEALVAPYRQHIIEKRNQGRTS